MKILISNDDGINAAGLHLLAETAAEFASVYVVAPTTEQSECSHAITTKREVTLTQHADNWYALDGRPSDCVRVGLLHICPDADWVLSGVNHGGNLGINTFLSGTVAAAREAAIMGFPAAALSQYRRGQAPIHWPDLQSDLRRVLQFIVDTKLEPHELLNVNFPAMQDLGPHTQIVEAPLDRGALPVKFEVLDNRYHYRGVYAERPRTPGHDVDVCFSGNIAISRIHLFGSTLSD